MKYVVLMSLLAITLCHGADDFVTPKEGAFKAEVVALDYLSKYQGKFLKVDFDPRFILKLKVLSDGDEKGKIYIFGIHSPSRMMIGDLDTAVGKKFDFKLDGKQLRIVPEFKERDEKFKE